jgi:TolA-binding protein
MTPQEIVLYLNLALSSLALLGHAKGYFSSGEKKLEGRVETLERHQVDHDRRIQSVEGEIKHMPDKDSFQKMQLDLAELKGQINSMVKSSEATERATRRVEDFLLKRGGE